MKKTLFMIIIGIALDASLFFLLSNKNSDFKFK